MFLVTVIGESPVRHEVQVEILRELMGQLDAGVNADAGGIRMCPTDTYTSQDLLTREWETFFLGHPHLFFFLSLFLGVSQFLEDGAGPR